MYGRSVHKENETIRQCVFLIGTGIPFKANAAVDNHSSDWQILKDLFSEFYFVCVKDSFEFDESLQENPLTVHQNQISTVYFH